MSFEYKVWLSPQMYSLVYQEMVRRGHTSVKETIKAVLLEAAGDKQTVANALALAELRKGVKDG